MARTPGRVGRRLFTAHDKFSLLQVVEASTTSQIPFRDPEFRTVGSMKECRRPKAIYQSDCIVATLLHSVVNVHIYSTLELRRSLSVPPSRSPSLHVRPSPSCRLPTQTHTPGRGRCSTVFSLKVFRISNAFISDLSTRET